jgi:hypothetical protein
VLELELRVSNGELGAARRGTIGLRPPFEIIFSNALASDCSFCSWGLFVWNI